MKFKLAAYEISVGIFKGILFGVKQETYAIADKVVEKNFEIYFGIFTAILTTIYVNIEEEN